MDRVLRWDHARAVTRQATARHALAAAFITRSSPSITDRMCLSRSTTIACALGWTIGDEVHPDRRRNMTRALSNAWVSSHQLPARARRNCSDRALLDIATSRDDALEVISQCGSGGVLVFEVGRVDRAQFIARGVRRR